MDPGDPGHQHMPQSVYASPLAHSPVLNTVCHSVKFFLHLSGADQILGLIFGSICYKFGLFQKRPEVSFGCDIFVSDIFFKFSLFFLSLEENLIHRGSSLMIFFTSFHVDVKVIAEVSSRSCLKCSLFFW